MVAELHFFHSKRIKDKEKKWNVLEISEIGCKLYKSNQKQMQPTPHKLLYRGILKKQQVVFIDFQFRWNVVARMKKISGAAYISENNLKNFKTLLMILIWTMTVKPNLCVYPSKNRGINAHKIKAKVNINAYNLTQTLPPMRSDKKHWTKK